MDRTISDNAYVELIEFFPLPFYVFKDEKIVLSNNKGASLLGEEKGSIVGKSLLSFLPCQQPEGLSSREKVSQAWERAAKEGFHRARWLFKPADREGFWGEVAVYRHGEFFLVTVINLDGAGNLKPALNLAPVRDYLTGVYDKRFFRERLESLCLNGRGKRFALFLLTLTILKR